MSTKKQHETVLLNGFFILALLALGFGAGTREAHSASSLTWNTFMGGADFDNAYGVTRDGEGNIYLMGESRASWGNPIRAYTAGADIYVAKLDMHGTLLWNTFLGGGAWDCCGGAIAVDQAGYVYVSARSDAGWGNPVRAYTSNTDAFVAKLNPAGTLLWHTFLGGSNYDWGQGIAVDGTGNVLVSGGSQGTWGSPVRPHSSPGVNDAFAAKLAPNGNLTWNTFFGQSGDDWPMNIAVEPGGDFYMTGGSSATWGTPVRPFGGGINDAYALKLNTLGALQWLTFLGGPSEDWGTGISLAENGNLLVSGGSRATWGTPRRAHNGDMDAFAAKLDPVGVLLWNTFLGGTSSDWSGDIDMDWDGNVFVSGGSNGTWGNPQLAYHADWDGFIAKLDPSGNLGTSLFVGGSGEDTLQGLIVGGGGNLYAAGTSSAGWGAPFRPYSQGYDAFVARYDLTPTFSDVGNGYWAWSWVERLYRAGVTTGCSTYPMMYCPEEAVNRAQMAIFLERGMRGAGYVPPGGTGLVFGDVTLGHWAVNWIEKLAADGITTGCGGGNYCPEDGVRRDQMAVFLLRARHGAAYVPPPATGVFADVPISHWAAGWIEQLAAEGITTGCGGGNYCPDGVVTRGQMAVFLVRAFALP